MSSEPMPKYVPTEEEVRGDSWGYCYGGHHVVVRMFDMEISLDEQFAQQKIEPIR